MTKREKLSWMRSKERILKAQAEARVIVASGICPDCGHKVRRNNSITGWWQCEQLGAKGFRRYDSKPACSWQSFTE